VIEFHPTPDQEKRLLISTLARRESFVQTLGPAKPFGTIPEAK
jgi:hypothetical protein